MPLQPHPFSDILRRELGMTAFKLTYFFIPQFCSISVECLLTLYTQLSLFGGIVNAGADLNLFDQIPANPEMLCDISH